MSRNVFEIAKAEREEARKAQPIAVSLRWNKRLSAEMQKARLKPDDWVTVAEAARRVGVAESSMRHLLQTGLLNSRMVAGRRLVEVSSVEREWERRNARKTKGTMQKAKCKVQSAKWRADDEHDDEYEREHERKRELRTGMAIEGVRWIDYDNDDIWAPARRACEILFVTPGHLLDMGHRGKLRRRWADRKTWQEIENPVGPNGRRVRGKWAIAMFSLKELNRLASARESKEWARGFSPNDPERPLRTSRIRTNLTAPPGDALITRAEAAAILNVSTMRISELVKRGTLFGWKSCPGKPGWPLYLSANQVQRLARNEEHLRRREIWLKMKARNGGAKEGYHPNELQERIHLWDAPGKALEQNHRDFYSTWQAATVLEVTRDRVLEMRRRGTLKGYRSVHTRETFNRRRHWFFKKDDVDALKLDSGHVRRSKAYWKARMPWAYGEASTEYLGPSTENGGPVEEEWFPHQVDHSPSPAAKMKMEMGLKAEN